MIYILKQELEKKAQNVLFPITNLKKGSLRYAGELVRLFSYDEEKYPYNDVIIGNMFNYSTDLDIDSYTDCDDNLDVLEENINVQKSQELKNNKTYTNGKCKLLQLIKNFFKA